MLSTQALRHSVIGLVFVMSACSDKAADRSKLHINNLEIQNLEIQDDVFVLDLSGEKIVTGMCASIDVAEGRQIELRNMGSGDVDLLIESAEAMARCRIERNDALPAVNICSHCNAKFRRDNVHMRWILASLELGL